MDNNYPYTNQYAYPYGYPPPNQGPYPPPPPYHPYGSPHHPYPSPANPPPPSYPDPYNHHSHSGPLPFPYGYQAPTSLAPQTSPQTTLQHHNSFHPSYRFDEQHQSASYPPPESNSHTPYYEHSVSYPSPETTSPLSSGSNSFSHHHRYESAAVSGTNYGSFNSTTTTPTHASAYPPLDDLFSNVHLSDNCPSAPALPPAPSVPVLPPSPLTPGHQIPSSRHDSQAGFYGYPNDSSSSNWEGSSMARVGSSNYPGSSDYSHLTHSGSFTGSSQNPSMQIVSFQKGSLKVLLFHGNLDIWVYEAKNLPNMDKFHKTLGDMFGRIPGNVANKIEGHMNQKITSDPYVSIKVAEAVVGRTYVISNSENPVWMQHFYVPVAHYAAEVQFLVKDSDVVGSQLIGVVAIPVQDIYSGLKVEGTYPILNNGGKPCKQGAVLTLSIQYTPIENMSVYHRGVGAGPTYSGVPSTYFPLRKGGRVTLYQDAHVPDGYLPTLKLDWGMNYVHGKCWHDIFDAVRQARRLIYITGWSVWHNVRLVRDPGNPASDSTLGDLLRSKSQEGVRVLLLVWDDPTSRNILGYKMDGIMQTHDEETRRFFKHSSVQVLLCPRIAGKRHSWVKQKEVETIYTHHQKTVIVDADAGNNRRKIVAFVGGLDLCDGRYDTPQHPIFRTLQTTHKDDYHNPTFTGNLAGCPREPWHDLHCKIDGPAAYDVLTNFEERWMKAAKPKVIKKLKKSYDDALLRLERIPDIIGLSDVPCTNENDPEEWHVQIFRSIDSNSVHGFPKDPKEATSKSLVCGKNVLIDMSIHTAYVKAIRAAQHYIYIENQYFIGSSYNWGSNKELGANNLIPMEIALKIASKIKANERFAVYIVIPMWPEGVPTGAATQRILFWQHKTMQMMYETVYKALVEAGLEGAFTPQDYLNFFCLGNREALDGFDPSSSGSPNAQNTPQALTQKSRRFMIYVHSKGMIVDDEYVILGSANINQRSMEGTRDTEIAMGAYQPHHTWERHQSNPHGQVYGYRMSLWAEHLGGIEDCFTEPESLECVRRVKTMSEMNWKQFAADEVTEMRAHLMKYPVEVDRKGKVRPLPGCETFPDVGGNIVGSFLAIQENLTI
ncbi:hypothetical protein SLE2022_179280 [Rubroshorea leprosula]